MPAMTRGGYPLPPDYEYDLPGTHGMKLHIKAFRPGLSIASVCNAAGETIHPQLARLKVYNMKIPTMPRENKPMADRHNTMMLNLMFNYRVTLRGQTFLDLTRAYSIESYHVV